MPERSPPADSGGPVDAPASPGAPTAAPLPAEPAGGPATPPGEPPTPRPEASPRAVFAAELAAQVARLLAAGDLEAARVAGDAMVRLLGSDAGQGGAVVDLAAERGKRGR